MMLNSNPTPCRYLDMAACREDPTQKTDLQCLRCQLHALAQQEMSRNQPFQAGIHLETALLICQAIEKEPR